MGLTGIFDFELRGKQEVSPAHNYIPQQYANIIGRYFFYGRIDQPTYSCHNSNYVLLRLYKIKLVV